MPAHHKIDDNNKVIITIWSGRTIDTELVDALENYHQVIKNRPEYSYYDEIVDFTGANGFDLSAAGMMRLSQVAARADAQGVRTKLAIIVNTSFAYGMGRLYQFYRTLKPGNCKEVHVFKDPAEALKWIKGASAPKSIHPGND